MAEKKSNRQRLPGYKIFVYLVILPLIYSAGLHYMNSMNGLIVLQVEGKARTEMDRVKYLLADSTEIRKLLLFYDSSNQYTAISKTNEKFAYSLPVLGQRELNIIKGKENNIFRSANEQMYEVNPFLIAGCVHSSSSRIRGQIHVLGEPGKEQVSCRNRGSHGGLLQDSIVQKHL